MTFAWTPAMIALAESTDPDQIDVVADWLEEHQCYRAAEVFRMRMRIGRGRKPPHLNPLDPASSFWAYAIVTLAKVAPDIAPRGKLLEMVSSYAASAAWWAPNDLEVSNMPLYGLDVRSLMGPERSVPPPLPPGDDERPMVLTCGRSKLRDDVDAGREGCKNEADDPHTCPYQEDINGDDETLCQCCHECQHECAMDI